MVDCEVMSCVHRSTRRHEHLTRTDLNIQPNPSLPNPKPKGNEQPLPNSPSRHQVHSGEQVLHVKEEGDVEEGAEEIAGRAELATTADYFEDFGFDFSFEGSVEFVPEALTGQTWRCW